MRATLPQVFLGVTLLLAAAAGACSSSTSPKAPSVVGTWTGTWNTTAATLRLAGSSASLTGSVVVGGDSAAVTGSVDSTGAAVWSSAVDMASCADYGTAGLALNSAADTLSGIVDRASGTAVCNPSGGGRPLIQQGLMVLARATP